jgi:hypothetical protein
MLCFREVNEKIEIESCRCGAIDRKARGLRDKAAAFWMP